MEINKIYSFREDFGKREKSASVSSGGMKAMFEIRYNFRLSVKFSTHVKMRKNRVPLQQLLQANNCASIYARYCTKKVLFPLT